MKKFNVWCNIHRLSKVKSGICLGLLMTAGLFSNKAYAQLSSNPDKFLGSITTRGSVDYNGVNFSSLWNQITCENESKWGSIEGNNNSFNWWGCDNAYNYAKNHNFPFKFHALIWGAQYPSWIERQSASQRYNEIVQWMDAVKNKYPNLQLIDVANECVAGHQNGTKYFIEALGGGGKTGWDWLIKAFELAYERWPNAILIYNDFNTFQWNTDQYIELVQTLRDAGAPIDAYGCQSHDLTDCSLNTFKNSMNKLQNALKMPMYITEYDIGTYDDNYQKQRYQEQFPVMWEADYCAGVTLWGHYYGCTWTENGNSGIIRSAGNERPAMAWLRSYMNSNAARTAKSPFPKMVKEASVYVNAGATKVKRNTDVPIYVRASLRTKKIDRIELYVNNSLISTMTSTPYAAIYRPTNSAYYTIKAVVYATDGSKYERYSGFTSGDNYSADYGSMPQIVNQNANKIVSGEKKEVNLAAVDFKSWNSPSANASSTGIINNNYGGGERVDGGALLYGDNEVSQLKYADLTGCTKLTIKGTDGMSVRALFNRQTATGNDYVEKAGEISNGKFEINLSEVGSYVHLNAIKTGWGSASGLINAIYVNDPNTPIDYYLSGNGELDESAINALADPNATNINVFGLNNEKEITLTPANKNCLIYATSNNKLTNTRNVVIKNGNNYTASKITLADGGASLDDIARAGFPWASTSGSAQWYEANNENYTFSWSESNGSVEIFHNLAGKTQNYLVIKTTEFTSPWGVRFYDDGGNLITEQGYWNGQASNNMIKEINIDSLFAKNNVSNRRSSLKTISLYGINNSGRVTLSDMYLVTGGNNTFYPFYSPYNIYVNNITCSINVNTFSPTWIPFECNLPYGFDAYDIINTNSSNVINKVTRLYPNKPVLLCGKGSAEFSASNVTLQATTSNMTNGTLVGVTNKTKPESGSYLFVNISGANGVAFQETNSNDNLYAYPLHAYMTKGATSSVVKAINQIVASGDANAIEETPAVGNSTINGIFNISGAPVSNLQKGINIIRMSDGSVKKVLVK